MNTHTSDESRGEGTAQSRLMERLEPFIGTWQEAAAVPGVPPGRMVFERALDGQIVVQRSEIDDPTFPDSLCIITANATGDGYLQHYFDTRGVVRVYAMRFDNSEWTLIRDRPDYTSLSFAQRFQGTFSADSNVIHGSWWTAHDSGPWQQDFEVTYTRLLSPPQSQGKRKRGTR